MYRSASSAAFIAGKDLLCSVKGGRHCLERPIFAQTVTRWRLIGSGARNMCFSTGTLTRLHCKESPGRPNRWLSVIAFQNDGLKRLDHKLPGYSSYCTAVFSKPAVSVIDPGHASVIEEGFISEEKSSDDENEPRDAPESDPWMIRNKVITFNTDNPTNKYPEKGHSVTFNVGYMDSGNDWHQEKKGRVPTILAIPGQPGSHDDMLPVVRSLYEEKGYRVVIVNMPGYEFTKGLTPEDTDLYQNSSTDLAEFILQFVKELQLSRVDMVVTHSAGSVPLHIIMASAPEAFFRSAMIICTPSFHVPSKVSRPMWFIKGLVGTWETTSGRRFITWFLPKFNSVVGWLNTNDPFQLMMTAKFGAYTQFKLMADLAPQVAAQARPLVYVASKNDKLVEPNLSFDWAQRLGINKDMFDVYDENYNLIKCGELDTKTYRKGVVLAKGGHYPQRKEVALPTLIREVKALMAFVVDKNE